MQNWTAKPEAPPPSVAGAAADDQFADDSSGTGKTGSGAVSVGTGAQRRAHSWSLKTEWSRAFALMLAARLVGALATIVGVRGVGDQVQETVARLQGQSDTVAELRFALDAHELAGHQLLSDAPVDRPAFLQQQQNLSRRFDDVIQFLPAGRDMRAAASKAHAEWQYGLAEHGLWDSQVQALSENRVADSPGLAASGAGVRSLLDGIQRSALESMSSGLAYRAELRQMVIAARSALFGLAAAGVVYFRSRMVRFLIRPTGLANRAALTERLAASFKPGAGRRSRHEGLLIIDVDNFNDVNDSPGHEGGDALLIQLAGRLQG